MADTIQELYIALLEEAGALFPELKKSIFDLPIKGKKGGIEFVELTTVSETKIDNKPSFGTKSDSKQTEQKISLDKFPYHGKGGIYDLSTILEKLRTIKQKHTNRSQTKNVGR